MKNNFFFKYVTLFSLLVLYSSCSNDNGLEFIEDVNQSNQNQLLQTKNNQVPAVELVIEYEFSPFSTEEEQDVFRAAYRSDMSVFFTIYDTVLGNRNCGTVEKWTVNEDEFDDYFLIFLKTNPPGGTTNASTGTASIKIVRRPTGGGMFGEDNDDEYLDCFTSSFPF